MSKEDKLKRILFFCAICLITGCFSVPLAIALYIHIFGILWLTGFVYEDTDENNNEK